MINAKTFIISFLCLLLHVNSAAAQQWFVEPGVFINVGYDENPRLIPDSGSEAISDSSDEIPQFVDIESENYAEAGGHVRIGSETDTELLAFDLAISAYRYNDPALDSESFRSLLLYQKTGLLRDYVIEAGFEKNSTLVLESEETGIFQPNIDRKEFSLRPSLTARLSTRWTGDFGLVFQDVEYDGDNFELGGVGSRFVDFQRFGGQATLRYMFSEQLSYSGIADIQFYRPKETIEPGEIEEEELLALTFNVDYQLSQRSSVSLGIGTEHTDVYQLGVDGSNHLSSDGGIYTIGFDHQTERSRFGLSLSSLTESDASIGGGLSQSERANISFARALGTGIDFNLTASYLTRNPIVDETSLLEIGRRDDYTLGLGLSWQANRNLIYTFNVDYRKQKLFATSTSSEVDADSTTYTIGARYDWGRKLIRR